MVVMITGQFNSESGRGIAGIIVELYFNNVKLQQYITGPTGRFKFQVEPGTYILKTFSTGGAINPFRARIEATADVNIGIITLGRATLLG